MARNTPRPATINRRGSPEAIAKRRAGRAFNDLWQPSAGGVRLDGRTEKRRQRLLRELEQGKARGSGRELKPLDVLAHVSELLELGVPLGTIRKVCRMRAAPRPDESLVDVVTRLHDAYRFRPEAYRFVGLEENVLRSAGVLGEARRSRAAPRSVRPGALGRAPAVGQSARRAAAANETVGQSARRVAAAIENVGQSARRAAAAIETVARPESASPAEARRAHTGQPALPEARRPHVKSTRNQ